MRAAIIVLILLSVILTCFLLWGDWFSDMFTQGGTVDFLQRYGNWAALAAIFLLISDLVLPLPGTIIMSALGFLYGSLWGGLLATIGSFLSGLVAYLLCRSLGEKVALRILGTKDLAKGRTLFATHGGWIVAVSRWLPMLPEVVACMAGLNRMPIRPFCLALACGSVPLGFTFAAIGALGWEHPTLAIALSALLPIPLWLLSKAFLQRIVSSGVGSSE